MRVLKDIVLAMLIVVGCAIFYVLVLAWNMGLFAPHHDTFAFHSCETYPAGDLLQVNVDVDGETEGRRRIMFGNSGAVMRTGGVTTAFGYSQLKAIEVSGGDLRLVFPPEDGKAHVTTITNVSESCRAELKTLLAKTFPVSY